MISDINIFFVFHQKLRVDNTRDVVNDLFMNLFDKK